VHFTNFARGDNQVKKSVGVLCYLGGAVVCALSLLSPTPGRAQNIISTVAGGGPVGPHPLSADTARPSGVVKDKQGNVYITGTSEQYVFKLDASGKLTVFAGKGYGGIGGAGGKATKAILDAPAGLGLDKKGNLFIADSGANHVWVVNASTGILNNAAGNTTATNDIGGYSGDNGPATKAQLNSPQGVAADAPGNVFIADTLNNVIRLVNTKGIISTYAGNGTACADPTTPCGDGGPARQANLNNPYGVVLDASGDAFIADFLNNRIRRVDRKTKTITTVAGNGTECFPSTGVCGDGGRAIQASLNNPSAVFVDAAGNLYIADRGHSRIRFVDANTQIITTVAGTGNFGFGGDGGHATSAFLDRPLGIFVDSAGNILIADTLNERIRQVTAGVISTIAGGGSGGDGHLATSAILAQPIALALNSSGDQFIADLSNNRIRRVNNTTHDITTVAGNGIVGYSGDNGPARRASLRGPEGDAIDSMGDVFIADSGNNVIRRVDGSTQVITTYAGIFGSFCSPPTDACGDGGPATGASFAFPSAVAVDNSGNLFIADNGDNRIRRVDAATQIITTVAGDGNACLSSTDPCGDGGLATSANLNGPFGIVVDASGNIFLVDSGDNRIRRVDATSQNISTVAFNGLPTFGGDGGPATGASMESPLEVAVDPAGNLFIGGGFDNVVQRVDAATGTIATVAGDATQPSTFGFSGDGAPATKAIIGNIGLAVDGSANLFIADIGNSRIRQVHLTPTGILSPRSIDFGDVALGQTTLPSPVTLSNTGGDDLQISNIATNGDFAEQNDCGKLLAPDQSCTITVAFTPTKLGPRNGNLTVTDDGPNGSQKIKLTGIGVR
jgi:trimeric autotransporter adhesin